MELNHSHHHHYPSIAHGKLNKIATFCSVTAVSIIALIKIIGWLATNSLTMLASLMDSGLDLITSLINLTAIYYASQPPDNEHRFGHNKAEDLAVFLQSSFFFLSGILLFATIGKRLLAPETVEHSELGIAIMFASIAITLVLVIIQKYVINKTDSSVVKADHLHYMTDLLANFAVIASLFISKFWHSKLIDPILAGLIGFFMLKGAFELIKNSFNNLMDHELLPKQKQQIISIITGHSQVKGYHDLKTRYAGNKAFIQVHIELDSQMILEKAHLISTELEDKIMAAFPAAEVIIHLDPEGVEEHISYHEDSD